jgi:transposase
MSIVTAGFDIHRAQITFDALDAETGEVKAGRIAATPEAVRDWVARFPDCEVHVALEACTGWYFVARALERAGAVPHLAEVAETRALRGRKRRAKTDRQDARWLRQLLEERRLPEAWIPPDHLLPAHPHAPAQDLDRRAHGLAAAPPGDALPPRSRAPAGRARRRARAGLACAAGAAGGGARADRGLPRDDGGDRGAARPARRRPETLRAVPARLPRTHAPLRHRRRDRPDDPRRARRRQAPAPLAPGRPRRRDRRRRRALGSALEARQADQAGSPQLRWALYEAAQSACRAQSPDHDDYLALRQRGLSHTRASLTIARKLARRCFHTLRELGEEALEPV